MTPLVAPVFPPAAPGTNPAFPPYVYPDMKYYQMFPGQQAPYPEQYEPEYEEKEMPETRKEVKKETPKKKPEPKKEQKKEHKKKEPKKEQKKEAKKEVSKEGEQKKEISKEEIKAGPLPKPSEGKKPSGEDVEEDEDLPPNYVQVDEKRQPLSIVFIGHVDVGKSTICGRIMCITEKVDLRTIKKYEQEAKEKNRESWWLAYVMDVNEEERQRGKTVEVGRATFTTETRRYTIYDAPGHANYVPSMIMGAAMADIGGLVISAKKGEFESGFEKGGQTLEHLLLAKSLGIHKLIVIINKMDEISVRWGEDRYEQIKKDLSPYISRYGFNVEKHVTWVPISGLTGANVAIPVETKICNWYKGPTLMEVLEGMELPKRDSEGPIRIPILDKMKDRGTDVFGKVHTGKIEIGTKVTVMPYKIEAEIGSIQNSDDQLVSYAKSGENVKLRLKGMVNEDYVYKGCILCSPTSLVPVFQVFVAEVKIVNLLKHKPLMSTGYQCVLHMHTLAEECTITELLGVKGPKDPDFKKAKFAREDDLVRCLISTKEIICAEKYSDNRQLGRFTLRDEGKTIAIGTVQKYKPPKESTST